MSDNEKEKLLSVYRTEFEILNSHLLYFGFDKSFLKVYIDLRSFTTHITFIKYKQKFKNSY